ncbi:cupin domain-containing protein [Erythrobacter rubeus]|uniref:Cupin domain-containing protein n=1 Tax=Erythrobacter rubeus TaxID=2760803 RepID=A0ABR8KKT1_9SPHN|nr:cupin domain-containing protein [Erythrobacter rubeus]MBD2840906.1 cupin domain-containing protein [Erythrobacter rubeus]
MIATDSADQLIEQLQLAPHPEGGWYRETYRAAPEASGRARGTAILFLLKSDESSHWHRVDADELWIWQGGDPLELMIAETDSGPVRSAFLGPAPRQGHLLQCVVPTDAWQAARPASPAENAAGYTLVSCVVVPGFDFAGFELAPANWAPGR